MSVEHIVTSLITLYNNEIKNKELLFSTKPLILPNGENMTPFPRSYGITSDAPYMISEHYNIDKFKDTNLYSYVKTFMEHREQNIKCRKIAFWIYTIYNIQFQFYNTTNTQMTDININTLIEIFIPILDKQICAFNKNSRNNCYYEFYNDIIQTYSDYNKYDKYDKLHVRLIQPSCNNINDICIKLITDICKTKIKWDDLNFDIDNFIDSYKKNIMWYG